MAKNTKIRVMLSSRCLDDFPVGSGISLSKTRIELKKEIQKSKVLGRFVFEVWINEDAPPSDAVDDSWETCITAVRDCDILIVLSNGNAGWAKGSGDIGICHAEYMEGLNTARGKVRLISLPHVPVGQGPAEVRDRRFQHYLQQQTAFRGGEVKTIADLKKRVFEALTDAVVTLTQRGVTSSASARFDMGAALDWTRLDFRQRKREMEKVLLDSLRLQPGARGGEDAAIIPISGIDVTFIAHAIPAAMSVPAARELVGRPFLLDHARTSILAKASGPVHLIACHRGATETQATAMLGFPDVTVVSGPFGVYVADDVQKVQFVFLVNCRDESQTRHALQRFLEWLEQTGESTRLATRAQSRARIVKVIADESNKE